MSSETLKAIMKHWTAPLPPPDVFGAGVVDLPFNLEAFCRENDERLAGLTTETSGKSLMAELDGIRERWRSGQ